MNTLQKHLKKIYVPLDCLFDTRMGALTLLNPDFAFAVTTESDYFEREQDLFSTKEFGTLDKDKFEAFYKLREKELVRSSLKTPMIKFLVELCSQFTTMTLGTPHHCAVEIEVNTYPFTLGEAERVQLLRTLLFVTAQQYPIRMVNIAPKALSASYAQENYCAMVMYNYHEWMNLHDNDIRKKLLKQLCLYLPRLYFGPPPSHEELLKFQQHNIDPFELQQHTLGPFLLTQYLPIELYCADVPHKKKVVPAAA